MEAAKKLRISLRALLNIPDADEALLTEQLQLVFEAESYHALFGKTQGYYGPYIWRDMVPTVYCVELPGGTAEYTVNILKGFIFRSGMDYLTFGRYGTGGWASPDGTINCIEQAYDFESEQFLVSLLKHEAQHTVDMKQFPEITPGLLLHGLDASLQIRIKGRCSAFRYGRWSCFMHIQKKWKKNMKNENMENKEMNNKASITALMSSFGRVFHTENEDHPVFWDHLAKELMTAEEYAAVQDYLLGGAQFFEPEIDTAKQEPKELLR